MSQLITGDYVINFERNSCRVQLSDSIFGILLTGSKTASTENSCKLEPEHLVRLEFWGTQSLHMCTVMADWQFVKLWSTHSLKLYQTSLKTVWKVHRQTMSQSSSSHHIQSSMNHCNQASLMASCQFCCTLEKHGLLWNNTLALWLFRCNTLSVESQLQGKRLRWLGHVFRMPNDRLHKKLVFGEFKASPT